MILLSIIEIKEVKSSHDSKKKKRELLIPRLTKIFLITLYINKYQRARKMFK